MSTTPGHNRQAFARLHRNLLRARLRQVDLRLRLELAALALLIGVFVFWQVRVPLAGLEHARGPMAAAGLLALALAGLALAGGALAATHVARGLRQGVAGPEWLALPLAPAALASHLAWESRSWALWVVVPAAGAGAAAIGVVPAALLVVLGVGFAGALAGAAHAGAATALQLGAVAPGSRPASAVVRALARPASPDRAARFRPAPWLPAPAWLALAAKDAVVSLRRGDLRRRLLVALGFATLALAAWTLPGAAARHHLAFALTLLAAALIAGWIAALPGSDPFAPFRVLPLGLGSAWGTRLAWAGLAAALLVAGHALAARGLAPESLRLFLTWSAFAVLGIGALGANYGITLYPRVDLAQRMLALSLGLSVAASIMIPLAGWVVLAAGVVHSARRLPRWRWLEEA